MEEDKNVLPNMILEKWQKITHDLLINFCLQLLTGDNEDQDDDLNLDAEEEEEKSKYICVQ